MDVQLAAHLKTWAGKALLRFLSTLRMLLWWGLVCAVAVVGFQLSGWNLEFLADWDWFFPLFLSFFD